MPKKPTSDATSPAPSSAPPQPLTVVSLEVEAFKRLRAAHVTPNATGLVPVRGRNAAGKSSLIESMLAALLGKSGKVDLPIMEGEHGAHVVVDLGELVVKRRWTRDSGGKAKTSLTVENADGVPQKGPQALLDSLVGRFADPVAFLDATPADQVKTVLAVLGLDEKLQLLEREAQEWYERRREVGRDSDRLGKALAELQLEVEALPDQRPDESFDQLVVALQEGKDHNASLDAARAAKANSEQRGKDLAARIEKMRVEMERAENEKEQVAIVWKQAHGLLLNSTVVDLHPIAEKLRAYEEHSKSAGRRELLDSTRTQHAEAAARHAGAEEALGKKRREIAELLGSVEFPIDGMAYDHESKTITIGGIPFSQASQAERLKAAAAVAMAGSPAIRVMFAREGSLLDAESRQQLAQIAEASGFQLWLEVVDSSREGLGVWIEDGEAFQ